MAKYTENFELHPTDLEIIETALRNEIARHSSTGAHSSHQEIRVLNKVLGKLYNQKVFYAQVNVTGIPAG